MTSLSTNLISAIAGRTLDDADSKLSILAVGDDDQNIYSFRGANVEFIRRFHRDYDAEVHHLVENYRSTRHIIEAANRLIAANTDRMKTDHPIRINAHRALLAAGGEFGAKDALTEGKVQLIRVNGEAEQAQAVIAEIRRLRTLGVADWSGIAVLSRTHRELAQVRLLAEAEKIPIRWWADHKKTPPLHQVREIHRFLNQLNGKTSSLARATDLIRWNQGVEVDSENAIGQDGGTSAANISLNPWSRFLHRMLEAWRDESDDSDLPLHDALEFLYETCAESRRDFSYGEGVSLSTIHSAKGSEYDHLLLIGAWPLDRQRSAQEETRRAFYVGMTRARQSLTILERREVRPSLLDVLEGPAIFRRDAGTGPQSDALTTVNYAVLGLDDINLSYAGYFDAEHPIHAALAKLNPGDDMTMRRNDRGIGLFDRQGTCVARLSRKAEDFWQNRLDSIRAIRVFALVRRSIDQEAENDRGARCRVPEWEIPVAEVVFTENSLQR